MGGLFFCELLCSNAFLFCLDFLLFQSFLFLDEIVNCGVQILLVLFNIWDFDNQCWSLLEFGCFDCISLCNLEVIILGKETE